MSMKRNHANSVAMKGNSNIRNFLWSDILLLLHIEKEGRARDILFSPPNIDIQEMGSNRINDIIIFTILIHTSYYYIKQHLASPPHVEKMGTLIASLEERALTKGRDKKLNTQTMCKRLFGSQGVILGGFKETIFEKKTLLALETPRPYGHGISHEEWPPFLSLPLEGKHHR